MKRWWRLRRTPSMVLRTFRCTRVARGPSTGTSLVVSRNTIDVVKEDVHEAASTTPVEPSCASAMGLDALPLYPWSTTPVEAEEPAGPHVAVRPAVGRSTGRSRGRSSGGSSSSASWAACWCTASSPKEEAYWRRLEVLVGRASSCRGDGHGRARGGRRAASNWSPRAGGWACAWGAGVGLEVALVWWRRWAEPAAGG